MAGVFNFEQQDDPLLPRHRFVGRVVFNFVASVLLIVGALVAGMAGFETCEGMDRVDAFLNASMLLSGMGPMHEPVTVEGKLFAGAYALFSGFIVIVASTILLIPIVHRLLHVFHLDDEQ